MKSLFRKIVKFWQRAILRSPKNYKTTSDRRKRLAFGFTLIELLVASLIASLLVSVLLGFLLGVLDSDRKETAKSNAQEELQAAISYISNDLQEAIYIYGADALSNVGSDGKSFNDQLPHRQVDSSAVCSPAKDNCTPVLVFWKRYNYDPNTKANYDKSGTSEYIGCMPYSGDTTALQNCQKSADDGAAYGRDTYTYSLVAYYLKNDAGLNDPTWSNTARILRWELKDGYVAYCATGGSITATTDTDGVTTISSPSGCPKKDNLSTRPKSDLITTPVPQVDSSVYFILPDQGFNRPDFASAGTLSGLAAGWRKYTKFDLSANQFVTLVDFMDDTKYETNQGGDTTPATAAIKIPIGKNVTIATGLPTSNPNCDDPSVGVGNINPAAVANPTGTVTQRVPADFGDGTIGNPVNPSGLSSFYACVAPENVTVRLFMRGNAIARLATPVVDRDRRKPTQDNLSFFPTADVRAFGRSNVGLKTR